MLTKRLFLSGHLEPFGVRMGWKAVLALGLLLSLLPTADLKAKAEPQADTHPVEKDGHGVSSTRHSPDDPRGPKITAVPSDPIPQVKLSAATWEIPNRHCQVDPLTSGAPNYIHFPPELFGGSQDFGGIAQHTDGRTYLIVGSRLLVGTGTNWQPLPTAPSGKLTSLLLATGNRLYVASSEDFGFLDLSSPGDPVWQSIRGDLPEEWRQGHAWQPAYEDAKGMAYFISGSTIVSHHPTRPLQIWRKIEDPDHIFSLLGKVYVLTKDLKVYRLDANGRAEIVQRDLPLSYGDIRGFVPYAADRLLVAAGAEGLALFDGETFVPFELNEFVGSKLVANQIIALGEDLFAVIDYANGLLIFRSDGTLLRQVQRIGGWRIRIAKALSLDRQGWMWLAHSSGLYRVEVASQGVSFNHYDGLEGVVSAICEHEDGFYAGTSTGLYVWDGVAFRHVVDVPAVESLVSTSQGLSIGTKRGLYVHHAGRTYLVDKGQRPNVFQSQKAPEYLFTPTPDGVYAYNLFGNRWRPATDWTGLPTSGLHVLADAEGSLWGEYGPGRLARYDFSENDRAPQIFTPKNGLPLAKVQPVRLGDEVLFLAGHEVLQFLPRRNLFTRSDDWQQVDHKPGVQPAAKGLLDKAGQLWVAQDKAQTHYIQFPPAGLEACLGDVLEFGQDPLTLASLDGAGHLWVGNSRGLRRYTRHAQLDNSVATPVTLIHRIESNGEILADFATGTSAVTLHELPAKMENIRIVYSILEYGEPAGITYTTKLAGYNDRWQPFTPDVSKEYNALMPGAYSFGVLGRTMDGRQGYPAVVEFSIPIAFHQTFTAKALAGFLGLVLLGGAAYFLQKNGARRIRSLQENVSTIQDEGTKNADILDEKERLIAKYASEKKKLMEEKAALLSNYGNWQLELCQRLRPSAAMISQLSMRLPTDELAEKATEMVKGLRLASESLIGGMRDLLDLRRTTHEGLPVKERSYDLRDVLDEALESVAAGARGRGIELLSWIEGEVNPIRMGNPSRVAGVITPLLVTALTQADEGELSLVVSNAESNLPDSFRFSIRAKGQTWDDDTQAHHLAVSDPDNLPVYRGRSHGLALARQLMKPMEGVLELYSGDEQAFGYDVSLNQPPVADHEPAGPAFADKLVLIVDENPQRLKGLQSTSERMGFQVRLANNGPQAMEALKESPSPDIVWIDLELDEEDGVSLLGKIREVDTFAELPALILTLKMNTEATRTVNTDTRSLLVAKPANHRILEAGSSALLKLKKDGAAESSENEIEDMAEASAAPSEAVDEDEDPIEAKIRAALAKSEAQASGSAAESVAEMKRSSLPVTVLLADAHEARASTMGAILGHLGKGAKLVHGASEVLSSLENDTFELILLAHPLDGGDAAQITRQIRDNLPAERCPVIISMGMDYPPGSVEAGIDDHIRLPLSVSALRLVLRLMSEV